MKKRAQAWGFDLIIGISIFLFGILTFYILSINSTSNANEKINSLEYDGNFISDNLLSEGYPDSWTSENVVRIGLLNNNKINETKLERFYDLSISNYAKTKTLLNTRYNYYISFSQSIKIRNETIDGIGLKEQNSKDLIKIPRYIIYNNTLINFYVEVWD